MHSKAAFIFLPLAILAGFLLFPKDSYAVPALTFGGFVATMTACPDQASVLVVISPPFPGAYMFTPTSVPLLFGPPTHVGQTLLGAALPNALPCTAGGAPLGAGLPVVYYGSSKI